MPVFFSLVTDAALLLMYKYINSMKCNETQHKQMYTRADDKCMTHSFKSGQNHAVNMIGSQISFFKSFTDFPFYITYHKTFCTAQKRFPRHAIPDFPTVPIILFCFSAVNASSLTLCLMQLCISIWGHQSSWLSNRSIAQSQSLMGLPESCSPTDCIS